MKRYNWEYDGEKMGLVEREDGICVLYSDLQDDGPKQGDKVWVKEYDTEWKPAIYVCTYKQRYHCSRDNISHVTIPWTEMTTEDPYALKYELTAQEALVAIGQGKKVRGNKTFVDVLYIHYTTRIVAMWKTGEETDTNIFTDQTYAIVEE